MHVLISGGSSGIGRAAALYLAEMGHYVSVLGRSHATVEVGEMVGQGIVCDFADLEAVRRVSRELAGRVDVVLANAGGMARGRRADRSNMLQVNHLANWLLARNLVETGASRVVWTSSAAQWVGHISAADLDGRGARRPLFMNYATTKLLNAVSAAEMARRYPHVVSVSVHPGVVATGLGRESLLWRTLWSGLAGSMESSASAGWTLAWLAQADVLSGGYYVGSKRARTRSEVEDPQMGRRVWMAAETLTGGG